MISFAFLDKNIQIIKNKEKYANIIFLIGIVLELIVMMTDHCSSWTLPYRGRVTHLAFILFCVVIMMTNYKLSEWIIICACGLLGVVSYLTCKDEYVIRCIVMVVASKSVDIKLALKVILWGTICGTVIIIVTSLFGINGNIVDTRDFGRGVIESRYCLGFNHANNLHDMLWYILCIYVLYRNEKIKWFEYIVLFFLNIGVYLLTKSRTGFLTVLLVICTCLIIKHVPIMRNRIFWLICGIFILSIVIYLSILSSRASYIYGNKICKLLDPILTGRLEMVFEHADYQSWEWLPGSRHLAFVDNGLVSIIYIYGKLISCWMILCVILLYVNLYKNNRVFVSVLLTSSLLVLFMESTFVINVSLLCNVFLILFMFSYNNRLTGD